MTNRRDPHEPPAPKELAAYRDGELAPADRLRVEAWLAAHPEAAADVHAWHRLDALFQEGGPAEPSEAEWHRAWSRVERQVARSAGPHRGWAARWRALLAAGGAAAAVIVLTVALGRWHTPPGDAPEVVEVFPVASNEDVEIVSVDAAGIAAVLVGELPFREPIVLMEPGDIALRSVERPRQGTFPEMRLQPDADAAPMILGPVAAGLEPAPAP